MSVNASFYQAALAILRALQVTPTNTNVNLLVAWELCEQKTGQTGNAWAFNNPLSTTEPGYGGTGGYNSAGVKAYPTQTQGAEATAATLENGDYFSLLAAIRTSDSSLFFASTGQMATWGTDMGCISTSYGGLPPVPTEYLSTSPGSAPGPSGSSENGESQANVAGTAPAAPRYVPWVGWGLVGVSLLAAGATVAVVETDTHWSNIRQWLGRPVP